MSIICCEKHDRQWDSDKLEDCPECESTPNVYEDNGYDSREDYLLSLSDDYGVPIQKVRELADILGMKHDFNGLTDALKEYGEEAIKIIEKAAKQATDDFTADADDKYNDPRHGQAKYINKENGND